MAIVAIKHEGLRELFENGRSGKMEPRGISVTAMAEALGLSRKHVSQIVNGHKRVEPTTAVRLALVLGTTARFWMNLRTAVDEWDASVEIADWTPGTTSAPPAPAGNDTANPAASRASPQTAMWSNDRSPQRCRTPPETIPPAAGAPPAGAPVLQAHY